MGCTFKKAPTAPRKPSCRRNLADIVPCNFSVRMLKIVAVPLNIPSGVTCTAEATPYSDKLWDHKGDRSGNDTFSPENTVTRPGQEADGKLKGLCIGEGPSHVDRPDG